MSWRLGFASGCLFSLQAVNISAAANPKKIFFILLMIKLILIISIYPRSVISIYRAKIATNTGIQEDTL